MMARLFVCNSVNCWIKQKSLSSNVHKFHTPQAVFWLFEQKNLTITHKFIFDLAYNYNSQKKIDNSNKTTEKLCKNILFYIHIVAIYKNFAWVNCCFVVVVAARACTRVTHVERRMRKYYCFLF